MPCSNGQNQTDHDYTGEDPRYRRVLGEIPDAGSQQGYDEESPLDSNQECGHALTLGVG